MESNLALFESTLQSRGKFPPEHAAEHLHRKKEGITRMDPALAVGGQSSGGNDAMDVRMCAISRQGIATPSVCGGASGPVTRPATWG